jgi:predicted nuclease of predicted toxin-antitoxin system
MRILLDTCVWGGAVRQLTELGHDVVWSGAWEADPGDREILRIAHQEQRVLVTQDKDFGELAIVHRLPNSGIIRLVGIPARRQAEYAHYVIERYENELSRGAIATIDLDRLRIRAEGKTWSVT